jgi:GNAT superfamily N-acetyltransferase
MTDRLRRLAIQVNWENLALGHRKQRVGGATFVRNTDLPFIYDANFMFDITASDPQEIDQLLALAAREYAYAPRLSFRVDAFTPSSFEARLAFDGYDSSDAILLVLDGALRSSRNRGVQILPIDQEGWRGYEELKRLDWREHAAHRSENPGDLTVPRGLASAARLKSPPVQYLVALENGRAVGYCSAWSGFEGVGQVEDLFVHPEYRHRGIGTALLHSCVDAARAQGAGPIIIVVDRTNRAKNMYVALGWRPLSLCRLYSMSATTS